MQRQFYITRQQKCIRGVQIDVQISKKFTLFGCKTEPQRSRQRNIIFFLLELKIKQLHPSPFFAHQLEIYIEQVQRQSIPQILNACLINKLQCQKFTKIFQFSIILIMSYSYIPADRKDTLLNFKYAGGTDSLTYQYLWSPFAEHLLKFIPEWVAPNLITFVALAMLIVVNIIFMLPDQNGTVPNWKLIMMAVSIFLYQHLDNLDGKQARKTKSSSPLGMLFDHGSDAVTAFLLAAQVMKILKLSYSAQLFCIYIFIMNLYFCAMWGQYSIGYFKLGRINPVDEGLPLYSIACIFATQINIGQIAGTPHILGTYGEEVIYFLGVLLVPQTIYMTKDIFKKAIIPKDEVTFLPWLYVSTGIAILLVYLSLPQLSTSIFYCFYYSLLFMWSRNMINIQLQHITRQKYRVFNRGTLSFLVLCGLYVVLSRIFTIDSFTFFLILFVVQGIAFFQFVVRVMNQGAQILGIWIFSLQPRKRKV